MKLHINGRANRISAKRWRGDCIYYKRKPADCKQGYIKCNPHTCTEFKTKGEKEINESSDT